MATILPGKKEQLQRDKKLVKAIKPKLRKFVIDQQVKNAAETAKKKVEEAKELLSQNEVINRASQLATKAFLDLRLWNLFPPPVEMKWLKNGPTTPALVQEMNIDIAGFASYLVREYRTFQMAGTFKRGYLSPLKEDNLTFFWNKFCADLKLLIETDKRLVSLGNKGIVIVKN